ncbi:MAG: hypothetical protein WA020_09555 [Candidatus Acidiferrales bacterium]
MDEYRSRRRDRPQRRQPHPNSGGGIQFLLSAEEQLLQSISAHAPLPVVLNKICIALDCQIGNVVSLVSLPGSDASVRAGIAMSALRFGLHIFCSESIFAENEELLGFLEMYSCVPRLPSPRECQCIKRATCLAAIAIKRDIDVSHQGNCVVRENRPVGGRLFERLAFNV